MDEDLKDDNDWRTKINLRNCSMSVALPVMSDLHLGQMQGSRLNLEIN